jgi:hypothetical protein
MDEPEPAQAILTTKDWLARFDFEHGLPMTVVDWLRYIQPKDICGLERITLPDEIARDNPFMGGVWGIYAASYGHWDNVNVGVRRVERETMFAPMIHAGPIGPSEPMLKLFKREFTVSIPNWESAEQYSTRCLIHRDCAVDEHTGELLNAEMGERCLAAGRK